ncbi:MULTISPECIES: BrnT family toxin [unclassified Devosia]|uniref:BrnT family toxin n=1 Tax=unclassified Devosia TaxID=196773 RepID=UPI001AD12B09|nr:MULTISPECIES: BrnT family toxin [unclassified Devosia]MBN9307170.1 BrnT family toxin [Devosia sp.]
MEFEWDETKRRTVFRERGVDLLYAARIFNGDVLTRPDRRTDYGEERLISTGLVDGVCYVVVHTARQGKVRLISAWLGGRKRHEQYQASLARRHQPDA